MSQSDIFANKQLKQSRYRKKIDDVHRFTCRQCGAAMAYSVGEKHVSCQSCGHHEAITVTNQKVTEHSLNTALRDIKLKPLSAPETEVLCTTCGASSTWEAYRLSDTCPYCQTPIAKLDTENNRIHIEAIIPFTVEKQQAVKQLSQWLKNRWFAPNVLKEMGGHSKQFEGIYVPHWTFDSLTDTDYRGQRGEHYIDYEHHKGLDGRTIIKPVTKTRWYPASGRVRVLFDDLLVLASMAMPKTIVNKLRPWQLEQAEPYNAQYLAGLKADYYQIDLDDALQVAKHRMANEIDKAIRYDIGGNLQLIHRKVTRYQNSTYKLLMLPVWYSTFEYKGKLYKLVINGQTGKVAGNYPKSSVKIAISVAVVSLLVLGALGYLYVKNH